MAIGDRLSGGYSIAEGRHALELFTDRYNLLAIYAAYLNDQPPPGKVLYLHGDGGIGKSLLLRYLKERCSNQVRPRTWQELKSLEGQEFVDNITNCDDSVRIPTALIDFSLTPRGADNPQDPFSALLMIRRALAGSGLRFPVFDYACVYHLHRTGRLSDETRRNLFPPEEMDFITEIVSAVTQSKWVTPVNVIMKLFGKHMREEFTLYRMHRALDDETVLEIQEMEPRFQLIDALPYLFAKDLNAAITSKAAGERVALFFDSHEAFWGDRHDLSDDLFHQRDEWLRLLIGTLELTAGITVVVAGRDRPRWHEAGNHQVSREIVDPRQVGGLPDMNASEFLARAGVADDELRHSLIEFARISSNESHPFMLALSADVVRAAAARNTRLGPEDFLTSTELGQKQKALLDRLLRYVNSEVAHAVRALSAARAFNLDVYLALAQALHFQATEPSFEILIRLSFVWQTTYRGQKGYRMHDIVRRSLEARDDDVLLRAHQALEQYYRARFDSDQITNVTEAVYHAGRLDWQRAIEEWTELFESALSGGRFNECRLLLELQNELRVETNFWRMVVARLQGEYFENLSRWDEAIQSYTMALSFSDALIELEPDKFVGLHAKALLMQKLGFICAVQSNHEQALKHYRQALDSCERAFQIDPESAGIWNTLGTTHLRIGDLQAQLSRHSQACESYRKASAAFDQAIPSSDQAIPSSPETIKPKANKASALTMLGGLQTQMSDYKNARVSLEGALQLYDELLMAYPDMISLYSNRGIAYTNLGRLLATELDWEDSIKAYQNALATYDEAISRSSELLHAYNNKASVTISIGEVLAESGRFEQAIERYQEAVRLCDEALESAPRSISTRNTKGLALVRLAQARAKLSQYEPALLACNEAITTFDEALSHAPKMPSTLSNKANALSEVGNILKGLSRYEEAGEYYNKAAQCLDEALTYAPDYINAHSNRALALIGLGEINTTQGDHQVALYAFREALAALGKASAAAPEDLSLKSLRSHALLKIGLRLMDLRKLTEAYDSLSGALHLVDQVLSRDSRAAKAHNERGMILTNLGLVSVQVKDPERALAYYHNALTAYREFQRLAPEDLLPHNNIANTYVRLGEAQAQLQRFDEAAASYNSAVVECSSALERSPNYPLSHSNKALAYLRLAQLRETTGDKEAATTDLKEGRVAICKALSISPDEPEFNLFLQLIDEHLQKLSGTAPASPGGA